MWPNLFYVSCERSRKWAASPRFWWDKESCHNMSSGSALKLKQTSFSTWPTWLTSSQRLMASSTLSSSVVCRFARFADLLRQWKCYLGFMHYANMLDNGSVFKFMVHHFKHFHSMLTNHSFDNNRTIALCPLWIGGAGGLDLRKIIEWADICNIVINAYQNVGI